MPLWFRNGVYIVCIVSEQGQINISFIKSPIWLVFSHPTMTTTLQLGICKDFASKLWKGWIFVEPLWQNAKKYVNLCLFLQINTHTHHTHPIAPLQRICREQCVLTTLLETAEKVTFWLPFGKPAAVWRRLGAIDLFSFLQILSFTRYFSYDFCWIVLRPNGIVLTVVELTWKNVRIVHQRRQVESVSDWFHQQWFHRAGSSSLHLHSKTSSEIPGCRSECDDWGDFFSPSWSSEWTWVKCWE